MSARLFCGSRAELHNEGSLNMQFYRFDGSLKSSGDTPPEKWENALAVLTSREAEEIPLPPELVPPEMPPMVNQTQFCVLKMQQKRMTGRHTYPRAAPAQGDTFHVRLVGGKPPAAGRRRIRQRIHRAHDCAGPEIRRRAPTTFSRSCSSTLSRATQGIYSTWNPGWTSWRSRCLNGGDLKVHQKNERSQEGTEPQQPHLRPATSASSRNPSRRTPPSFST